MPPIEPAPCSAWISRNRRATKPIASSHSTSRHGSVIVSRIIGFSTRSGWLRVAEREAALHAGVALVGAAVLVGHHPDQLVAAQLGLERAADAAVGARGDAPSGSACRAR